MQFVTATGINNNLKFNIMSTERDNYTDSQLEIQDAWEFVSNYYPSYSNSAEIYESDLLQRIVDGEYDIEDLEDSATQHLLKIAEEIGSLNIEDSIREAQNRLYRLNCAIYQTSIAEYVRIEKNKTYFLFGSDQVRVYEESVEELQKWLIENVEEPNLFVFIEGETRPEELADAMYGWNDFTTLDLDEYNKLTKK